MTGSLPVFRELPENNVFNYKLDHKQILIYYYPYINHPRWCFSPSVVRLLEIMCLISSIQKLNIFNNNSYFFRRRRMNWRPWSGTGFYPVFLPVVLPTTDAIAPPRTVPSISRFGYNIHYIDIITSHYIIISYFTLTAVTRDMPGLMAVVTFWNA